jgi:hypothetical protein
MFKFSICPGVDPAKSATMASAKPAADSKSGRTTLILGPNIFNG